MAARLLSAFLISALCLLPLALPAAIDREALVTRHNPQLTAVDYDAPLTVGNGNFAYTVDVTGLQTFPAAYHRQGVPTETLSRWAWVSDANPEGYQLSDAFREYQQPDGRWQGYPTASGSPAGQWLRKNPRVQPLGQIGLAWAGDKPIAPDDIKDVRQTLDLWHGAIHSRYRLEGEAVTVTTACLPDEDTILLRLESALVGNGVIGIRFAFPRGYDPAIKNTPGFDWSEPEAHTSTLQNGRQILRRVNDLTYAVSTSRTMEATAEPHVFIIHGEPGQNVLEVAIHLGLKPLEDVAVDFERVERHWPEFWRTSAAADFSGSTNPLAAKFERRIVLSQYLMAVQMAGDVPPQESGLTCSTWYGKHHTEMIWWHAAHFALWGHPELLSRNLDWYVARLPEARALARERRLDGARWAKMVGPKLRESPGGNPLIVWNQPHPIYLSELLYRQAPTPETLERYGQLVQETAEALASMLWLDPERGEYVLGPPLWIAQEIYDQRISQNPPFELAAWRWSLGVAQQWRERRGLERDPHWDEIIAQLASLPTKDGKYVAMEAQPDTWDNVESRHDHPSMLMALGVLPQTDAVDPATMDRTLDAVLQHWDWETKIWGWDYPMIAMTATRLGRPDDAVEILLREGPNNGYLPNGICPQRVIGEGAPGNPRYDIAAYFPANGSFLAAAALMLGGWDGADEAHPGIPQDGTWEVQAEGWQALP
ncbi:MAG: hypothetical protein Q7P63_08390 [Verrucomicrobiota bacterium JB022]|nr:hypothetical protein [Verrucomicrobiota bacterium JB022]